MLTLVDDLLKLVLGLPAIACAVGLFLHSVRGTRPARRSDAIAIWSSLLALAMTLESGRVYRALGASPVELRQRAGWLFIALMVCLPVLFLSGAALLISGPSQQRPGGLGERLK
jgi:hypothetical protein